MRWIKILAAMEDKTYFTLQVRVKKSKRKVTREKFVKYTSA